MTQDFNNKNASLSKEGLDIDPKRIIYQATRYWYLIALSILTGLTVAFLINRYATRIYSINASIIIKETQEASGGELLYNNPLVKFYRNYLNEIYIIRSIPLIERTVQEQGFDKTFFRIGNFLTTESYKTLPFSIDIIKNEQDKALDFNFDFINDDKFSLSYFEDGEKITEEKKFGEEIIIKDVVFKLNVNKDLLDTSIGGSFAFSYKTPLNVARSYAGRLQAEWAEEGAGVINLSIRGANANKEIDFLNGLIENYQQYDLDKKNVTATNTIEFINDQLNNISDSLSKAERQLEVFKNKNIVTDLNSEALRLYQKVEGFEVQKSELIIRDSYYNYLINYINTNTELDKVILPSSVGITDQILIELVSEIIKIQTDIKMLTRSDKLESPFVADGRKRINVLKGDILESIDNQKSVDKIKLDFLGKNIKEIEKQLSTLPLAERQFINIKRNYALLESLYVFLLQKRAEAGISKASNTSDIVVVNPPIANGPISPSTSRNYFLGLSLGLTLPFIFFVILELSNTRVQSREDVERITTIPFIGGVGHKRLDINLEVLSKPKSAISESFRALRSNLNYFLQGKEKGVFLITSSISGEGKTFTSINLASVFALSGKKTLIVGADMRKPKIFADFNLDNSIGLSNYLAGLATLEEITRTTDYPNLNLISGGPVPPNPSELILSDRMSDFLSKVKAKYDFIFIDSPPLALVTDAFVLSGMVDHTLFIVRQNYTPKPLLRTIDDFYKDDKIKNISLVLNDIYKSGPGYGYGYSYGYGYHYGYGYGTSKNNGGGYYE